jgi:predicted oxidoreductase (fatty acid repression mutant protein)
MQMQIPLWLFISSLLLAVTWRDMATLLRKRSVPTSSNPLLGGMRSIRRPLPLFWEKNIPSFLRSNTHSTPLSISSTRHFSSTAPTATASMSAPFLDAIKNRRTIYALKKESTISDKQVQDIVEQAVLHVPSSFNSQSTRVVLLVKEEHDKLWDIAKEVLKSIVTEEQWKSTEQRLNGFQAAYGTVRPPLLALTLINLLTLSAHQVLFFESRSAVTTMQEKFAIYADRFPTWATQSDAMHQFAVWTALETEGLGCNLQHYNPLIDAKVAEKWGIDKDWVLNAQLVFGTPAGEAGPKTFIDVGERFKVFGA